MRVLMMPDCRANNPYQTLLAEALTEEGATVEFSQDYRRVFPFWRALRQSQNQFEIFHLHWTHPYLKGKVYWIKLIYSIKFLIDIWLVKLSGAQVVWTVHNLTSHEAKFPKLECWVHRQLARECSGIIVHHQNAKADVIKQYQTNSEKISVIPHGHYRTTYGPPIDKIAARQQLGLPLNRKLYLTFGMLRPYKGIETLLATWQQGKFYDQQGTLLIAGMSKNKPYLRAISDQASQVDQTILHSKYIEDADIPIYFSAADIVVLPFKQVSTSGSLLLAMSYGKPVIAPRIGGLSETLDEAGELLYNPSIEQGLLHAMKDSLVADLSGLRQRVEQVCDRMGWQAIAQKTYQLYQSS